MSGEGEQVHGCQRKKAVQLQLAVTRPREPSFAEGNLGELPLFVLNTQDARPELSKDLERVIDLGVGPDGGRRRLTIMAGSAGYPTMFAALVLQAIIERALEGGLDSPVVYVTRHYIARRLRYRRPQASDFRRIDMACEVGLKKTAPSAVLDALAPALKQLAGELEVSMRDGSIQIHRFLEEWKVDPASGNIIFRFFRENQRPEQQPVRNEFLAAIERIRAGARK